MGLLKRKEEKSETISVRVPASLKAELEELRKRADTEGFDLTATITEALVRLVKQVRSELDGRAGKTGGARRTGVAGVSDGRAA
jgi:uncharacterized protein YicC (UPF0701 family)